MLHPSAGLKTRDTIYLKEMYFFKTSYLLDYMIHAFFFIFEDLISFL